MDDNEATGMNHAADPALPGLSEAFERLYDRAVGYAVRQVLSLADAEDVVSESFTVVLRHQEKGTLIEDLDHYIMGVVARTARRHAMRGRRRDDKEEELGELAPGGADPVDAAMARNSLILKAAEKLSADNREAVLLRYDQGWSEKDIARHLEISENAAQKKIARAKKQLGVEYVRLAASRAGESQECQERTARFVDMLTVGVPEEEHAELQAHAKACQHCGPKLEDLLVATTYTVVLPVTLGKLLARKAEVLHLVASRQLPAPQSHWLNPRRVVPAAGIAAALLILAVAAPPLLMHRPSSAPARPPSPANGFAYLDHRELFYAVGVGKAPVQVTSTGGRVDDFAWNADGRSLVYKVKNSDSTQLGDLHQVVLATKSVTSWTVHGASAFAISPDGRSYVATAPVHNADGSWSYRVLIGGVGQGPDPSREVDLRTWVNDRTFVGYLSEVPEYYRSMPGGGGPSVLWTSAGIFFLPVAPSPPGFSDYQIDPSTKTVTAWTPPNTVFDPLFVYRGPASMPFAIKANQTGSYIQIDAAGKTSQVKIGANRSPVFLSVSGDGKEALLTSFVLGGVAIDVQAISLDGTETEVTTDGNGALAQWQPPLS